MSEKLTDRLTNCFIISPLKVDLSGFKDLLVSRGVSYRTLDRREVFGSSLSILTDVLRDSDFTCIFLMESSPNLMFEAGIAMGLGKPAFIVAPRQVSLPFDLASTNVVRVDNLDISILEAHFDAFLKTLPSRKRRRERKRTKQKHTLPVSEQMHSIRAPNQWQTEIQLENFVAELFRGAGFEVIVSPFRDESADMAVWSARIKNQLGNPLLVEVKNSIRGENIAWIVDHLSQQVRLGRGSFGIVVSPNQSGLENNLKIREQPVLFLSLEKLVEVVQRDRLIDTVKEVRNEVLGQKA